MKFTQIILSSAMILAVMGAALPKAKAARNVKARDEEFGGGMFSSKEDEVAIKTRDEEFGGGMFSSKEDEIAIKARDEEFGGGMFSSIDDEA